MTQKDFDSIFTDLLGKHLPPPADPREIVVKIFRRDQWRTRILAGLSLFFWLIGTSGLLLLLWGLNRLIIFIRIDPSLPWNVGRPEMNSGFDSPREFMFWGTQPVHQCMPFIACSIVSLMLAAVFTILLVYSSRRATLNRINLSLQQISLQLKQMRDPSDDSNKKELAQYPRIPMKSKHILLLCGLTLLNVLLISAGANAQTRATGPDSPDAPSDRIDWGGGVKASPFAAVRWRDSVPEVQVNGIWSELVSIDDLPADQIVNACKKADEDDWRKRFGEDLVPVLIHLGHQPGASVTLKLKDLKSGEIKTQENVAMSEENRQAIFTALRESEKKAATNPDMPSETNQPATQPSAPPVSQIPINDSVAGTLTQVQAMQDLDTLQNQLETGYSYLKRRGVDYKSILAGVRGRLGQTVATNDLKIDIEKLIAQFGDGHSGVEDLDSALPSGYTPFLTGDTDRGLVVFRDDRKGLLDPDHPYLISLDGIAVEKWLAAAQVIVPAGSPQFIRSNSIRSLRFVNFLRREMGLPAGDSLAVEIQSPGGNSTKTLHLPLANRKPIYGPWPRSENHLLPQNIGYFRLPSMDSTPTFLHGLKQAMGEFKNTRGLIIDVRGNGGGSRDALSELFPYFMKPTDPPRMINVSAFRLHPGDKPDAPEGYLADRGLYPLTSRTWTDSDRAMLQEFAKGFPPNGACPPVNSAPGIME